MAARRVANDTGDEREKVKFPDLYTRVNISRMRLLQKMEPHLWFSLSELVGKIMLDIAPECAIRHYRARRNYDAAPEMPLGQQRYRGVRIIVAWWSSDYVKKGFIQKRGAREKALYRLTKKGILCREKANARSQ